MNDRIAFTISFKKLRSSLIKDIERKINLLLKPTQYGIKAFLFRTRKGNLYSKNLYGMLIKAFLSFAEGGIIQDIEGHGMPTISWDQIPLEDLTKMWRFVEKL